MAHNETGLICTPTIPRELPLSRTQLQCCPPALQGNNRPQAPRSQLRAAKFQPQVARSQARAAINCLAAAAAEVSQPVKVRCLLHQFRVSYFTLHV